MRIVGGALRGHALAGIGKGDAAAHLRPTADRVRESLFNMLGGGRFGDPLTGAAVLDVFAGTGALGLEALSRGAASVAFLENGRKAQALIRENVARCGVEGRTRLICRDATRPGEAPGRHGLVFLDPPWRKGLGERALDALLAGGWIAGGALVVWEEAETPVLPAALVELDRRRYGDTSVTLARADFARG